MAVEMVQVVVMMAGLILSGQAEVNGTKPGFKKLFPGLAEQKLLFRASKSEIYVYYDKKP